MLEDALEEPEQGEWDLMHFQRQFVASGCFVVYPEPAPIIIEALLGTCVGVAIHDATSGVGGLLHLLLPEPVSRAFTAHPQRYATTGLPLFLRALEKAGGNPKNFIATVAGGALVGPIADQDLALNIGGRTAERVQEILRAEKIRISQSETGGFFTCRLELDMHSGQSRIEPTTPYPTEEADQVMLPNPSQISNTLRSLRPIPQVALKLLRLIGENAYDIQLIADQVCKDQVLTAQTLRLCNSVMYARRNRIDSLDAALVILGQDQFEKLVLAASLKGYFDQCGLGYSLCKGGLYHHGIGTATVAGNIARFTGRVHGSLAYTAGLIHDIGKVVLDQHIASTYPLFYRCLEQEASMLTVEKQVLGTDHTEVGWTLGRQWNLPESLCEATSCHHEPELAKSHGELVHVVHLADLLMSRFHTGLELERVDTQKLAERLRHLGLDTVQLPELIDLMPPSLFDSVPEMVLK